MVVIRLKRTGTKSNPHYSIVVTDKRNPRDGRFIEEIGKYDPNRDENEKVLIDGERATYWLSKGAVPSDRVKHFFGKLGLISDK